MGFLKIISNSLVSLLFLEPFIHYFHKVAKEKKKKAYFGFEAAKAPTASNVL